MDKIFERWMQVINYEVSGSFVGLWDSYKELDVVEFYRDDDMSWYASIEFSRKHNRVVNISIVDFRKDVEYRMFFDEDYRINVLDEEERKLPHLEKEKTVIELDIQDDFFEKMTAIINHQPYSDDVMIEVDISDEVFLKVAKLAHENDMTFNQYCCKILEEELDKIKGE